MTPPQLLTHFNRVCEAPDAIPRLRKFILDLAVRGKLTNIDVWPQRDEPVGGIATLQNGYAFKSEYFTKIGVRLLRNINVGHGVIIWNEVVCLPPEQTDEFKRFQLEVNDVIISLDRPFIVTGIKVARIRPHDLPCLLLQRVGRFKIDRERLCSDYFLLWLNSSHFADQIDPGRSNGVPHISSKQVEAARIFIPSLIEQHRIVSKVAELMALCDRLEAAQTEREQQRDRLLAASLQRLNRFDEDASVFRDHARFHLSHLSRTITRPEQIIHFRKLILELAFRGYLTADWRAENASCLDSVEIVNKMEASHQAAGGHRQGNAASATEGAHNLDSKDMPQSWKVTDFRTAVYPDRPITYGILMPGPDVPDGIPYVRVADFPKDRLNLGTIRRTAKEIEGKYARARLKTGDILLSIRGTIGRICVVPPELQNANITQDTARLSLQSFLSVDFVVWFLRSPSTQQRMQQCSKGVAVRGINIGDVRALQLPVPPLAEQHRIVAKVDELMAVCDELEAQLTTAQTERRRFLEAVLQEALAAAA